VGTQNPTGVGVFRSGFLWILDSNFNQVFDQPDVVTAFGGIAGDIPVVGDWNGNGVSKIGIYRNGTWLLDFNGNGTFDGSDKVYQFGGIAGDVPVVGDWNGTGYSKVGLFRSGFLWILDTNGTGAVDAGDDVFAFGGVAGDKPIVGDWNGSGTSKVGVVRSGFLWILDTNGNKLFDGTGAGNDDVFAFGGVAGDVPLVGDWNNSGFTNVGVFRSGFYWVLAANRVAPYTGTQGTVAVGSAFAFGGAAGDVPVVGRWR
jgi:hypothetical protein